MLKISNIKLPLSVFSKDKDFPEERLLTRFLSKELREAEGDIRKLSILRRSTDARKKPEIYILYSIAARFPDEDILLKKYKGKLSIERYIEKKYEVKPFILKDRQKRPLIVGDGPAGLFAAYILSLSGMRPIIFERGAAAEERAEIVKKFFSCGELSKNTNVCFGEGGAGTFSDGKLNTLTKDRDGRQVFVLETFHRFGADKNILYDAKPHIGTDRLLSILPMMRKEIEALGGEFHFETEVTDLLFGEDNGERRFKGLITEKGDNFLSDACILSIGHSARDTMRMLHSKSVLMKEKDFAVGLRIEHPQRLINESQYGMAESVLPPAAYKLTGKGVSQRNIWTFCMCPGGKVINSSSENGLLSINGMSNAARDGENANSALIVSVGKNDYKGSGPLCGIAFQEELEKKAYALSKGLIPQQLFADFRDKRKTSSFGEYKSDTLGKAAFSRLDTLFSDEIHETLVSGINDFGKKIKGFSREDAILSGVESRTSSPVRIERDESFQSVSIRGLFPCGEGAGYAGGIMSAAVDGIKCAEKLLEVLI